MDRLTIPTTLAQREALDREIAAALLGWEYIPGDNISAGLLCRDHYVASIRYDLAHDVPIEDFGCYVQPRINLSYRPPGTHEHVGCYHAAGALEYGRAEHAARTL